MSEEKMNNDGWETAESGSFLKFENPGDGFIGLLVSHEAKSTAKGPANEYKVVTPDGFKTFYAPKGLHDALSGVIIKYGMGKAIVKATFKEKIKTASGNDFKVFDVMHRPKTEKDLKEFGIDESQADPNNF